MRQVQVVPHQHNWHILFNEECHHLHSIFGDYILSIHHIGSTSIAHIAAKPVIDLLIEVINIHEVDTFNEQMERLGYSVRGENGIANRRFYTKGGDNRTHHVHIYEQGHPEIDRHLAFRDYLNAHPADAQSYSKLKQKLAAQFPYDITQYIAGKHDFIQEIDQKADAWKNKQL